MATAHQIVVCDISNEKLSKSLHLGASDAFNTKNFWPKDKFEVIIDTTGIPELLDKAVHSLSDDGRLVMVGQPQKEVALNFKTFFGSKGKKIISTQGGSTNPSSDIPRYAKLYGAGKLSEKWIISHEFSLKEINKAVNILKTGPAGRIIIHP